MAMSRLRGASSVTSRSPMRMRPLETPSSPAIIRSSVDFPQPDGPTRTMNSPSPISRSTSSTASTPPGKTLLTPSRAIPPMLRSFLRRSCRVRAAARRRSAARDGVPPPRRAARPSSRRRAGRSGGRTRRRRARRACPRAGGRAGSAQARAWRPSTRPFAATIARATASPSSAASSTTGASRSFSCSSEAAAARELVQQADRVADAVERERPLGQHGRRPHVERGVVDGAQRLAAELVPAGRVGPEPEVEHAPVGVARADRVVGPADDRDAGPVGRAAAQRAERVVDHERRDGEPEPLAQRRLEQREVLRPVGAREAEHGGVELRRGDARHGQRLAHRRLDRRDGVVRRRGVVDVRPCRARPSPHVRPDASATAASVFVLPPSTPSTQLIPSPPR